MFYPTEGGENPMMSYEAMMVMLTFGSLIVGLIGLVVVIIKIMIDKKK